LQEPKPKTRLVEEVILISKQVSQRSLEYSTAESEWSLHASAEAEEIGRATDRLAFQFGSGGSAVRELNQREQALKSRVEVLERILKQLQDKCKSSAEWKRLSEAYQDISKKPLQVCEELSREEKGENK
jgi:hypothetical protein